MEKVVRFVADSSCDIVPENGMFNEMNMNIVPMKIYTDEKDFIDNSKLDVCQMMDYLASYNDRSYTSCPSAECWMKAFEGADEIYVIALTSNLSGTYNSACIAKDLYLEGHPDAKIFVLDSLSTGPEMRILIEKMIEYKKSGMDFEQVCEKITAYKEKTRLFFSFMSLHNFAQNGRVSKVVASTVGMLNISILGTASEEGNIEVKNKVRGEKSVIRKLKEELKAAGYEGKKIRICHMENEDFAKKVSDAIKSEFNTKDLEFYPARGLCSYYGERGGLIIGCDCN